MMMLVMYWCDTTVGGRIFDTLVDFVQLSSTVHPQVQQ